MPGLRMRATAWRASQDPQADTAVVTLLEANVLEPLQAVHWERSRKSGRGWEGTLEGNAGHTVSSPSLLCV